MQAATPNIIDHLLAYALKFPDKTVYILPENGEEAERRISYHELKSRVKTLSFQLSVLQLKGQRALLVYQDILEFIISFLACQYCGIIPVPVPYGKGNKQFLRLINIIDNAQVAAIFCKSQSIPHLQEGLYNIIDSDKINIIPTDLKHSLNEFHIIHEPNYDETAFIQYTSGSTGRPKGVVITHRNINHNQQMIADVFGCDHHAVIFSWLPFHHDMGLVGNILHAIYTGSTCVLISPVSFIQSPRKWLEGITKYKVTHSGGPNFAYDLCVNRIPEHELAGLDLSTWRVAYNGSEPVRSETIQRFSDYFQRAGFRQQYFYPCYGLSEATLLATGRKRNLIPTTVFVGNGMTAQNKIILTNASALQARPIVSSGEIPPGTDCMIISTHNGYECAELEEGEICISGDNVTQGYWNMDDNGLFHLHKNKRFLKTGDLGFLYKGEIFVHGRIKEMLIIRGENYYPYDIEKMVAESHPDIEPNGVALFGMDDSGEMFALIAEIKRTSLKTLDAGNLILSIDAAVSGSIGTSPYDIILTDPLGIPRTTSGKLQRVKCKDNYLNNAFIAIGSKIGMAVKKERKKNEALLHEVFRSGDYETIRKYVINVIEYKIGSLQYTPLTNAAELTDIGLDSLRSMEIINIINRDLNISIDTAKVVQDNTLTGLIAVIENILWLKNGQPSGKGIII